jgi:hypothetical protein
VKYHVDHLRTAIQYAREKNSSDWVSVSTDELERLVFYFQDNFKNNCSIFIYPAEQSVTPQIQTLENLYYKEE